MLTLQHKTMAIYYHWKGKGYFYRLAELDIGVNFMDFDFPLHLDEK